MKSFIGELRGAAMTCINVDYRSLLRCMADAVQVHVEDLRRMPSTENMTTLNGVWSKAVAVLDGVPAEADPNAPLAGSPEAARLAA